MRRTDALPATVPRRTVRLPPLPPADARTLFLDRWDGELEHGDAAVLDTVLARLEGLPLALELAAHRARGRSLSVLARADAGSSSESTSGSNAGSVGGSVGEGAHRHGDMAAAVRWSWEVLDAASRTALTQLSVFQGAFAPAAAEAVVDLDDDLSWPLDVVHGLVSRSLLAVDEGGRFRLYRAVRELVAGELPPEAAARARHARWMARAGTDANLAAAGGPRAPQVLADLVDRRDDLDAACRWAVEAGEPALAARAFLALAVGVRARGPVRRGLQLVPMVVEAVTGPLRGAVCLEAALLRHTEGDQTAERELLREAIRVAQQAHDPVVEARARSASSTMLQSQGRHAEAVREGLGAVELARTTTDQDLGAVMSNLGLVYRLQGRLDEAAEVLGESLRVLERARAVVNAGIAVTTLGNVHRRAGRVVEARRCYRRALQLHRKGGNLGSEVVTLASLGHLLCGQQAYAEAYRPLRRAAELADRLGMVTAGIMVRVRLGRALVGLGRLEEGRSQLGWAIDRLRARGQRRGLAEALEALARAEVGDGALGRAEVLLVEARGVVEALAHRPGLVRVTVLLAEVQQRLGRQGEALRLLQATRWPLDDHPDHVVELLLAEAELWLTAGRREAARGPLAEARARAGELSGAEALVARLEGLEAQSLAGDEGT